jgi:hypothetical protein
MAQDNVSAASLRGKKRGRADQKARSSSEAYEGFRFELIESTGRPGTPRRYFDESYRVQCNSHANDIGISPIIHKHANGLCIVTAGDISVKTSIARIDSVQLFATASPSGHDKRETTSKKSKMQKDSNSIRPMDVLAELHMEDGTVASLPSCVVGDVLEVNHQLTPDLLAKDSLLDGYLAVIRPAGPFPPKIRTLDASKAS